MTCGFFEEKGCLEVPIGMKISELVRTEMIPNPSAHAIFIDGGLMSGKSVNPEKAVVHDTMQSLILMPKITECEQPCMHCGNCATVCPMGLRPFNGNAAEARQCIGCGNCSYICPSRRRLKEYMVHGGQPTLDDTGKKGYIYLKQDTRRLPAAVITGHSSPFVREGWMPFTCFLPPYQL
jgi:Na+-translocating ferredoxin:NAD+ oxidoreductase RnfC subunit